MRTLRDSTPTLKPWMGRIPAWLGFCFVVIAAILEVLAETAVEFWRAAKYECRHVCFIWRDWRRAAKGDK